MHRLSGEVSSGNLCETEARARTRMSKNLWFDVNTVKATARPTRPHSDSYSTLSVTTARPPQLARLLFRPCPARARSHHQAGQGREGKQSRQKQPLDCVHVRTSTNVGGPPTFSDHLREI